MSVLRKRAAGVSVSPFLTQDHKDWRYEIKTKIYLNFFYKNFSSYEARTFTLIPTQYFLSRFRVKIIMHVHKTKRVQEKSSMSWPNGQRVFKRLVMGLCTFMHPQIHGLYRLQKYLVLTLLGTSIWNFKKRKVV